MKTSRRNLHHNGKRTLGLAAVFSLISVLLSTLIGIAINSNASQMLSLFNSSYEYSVITSGDVGQDEYYIFNAGNSFSVAPDSRVGINADIVMQPESTSYTESVEWNAGKLAADEIAISGSLAQRYNLKAGDKLYSKHVVSGAMTGYVIKRVLQNPVNTRITNQVNAHEGIIIMGYDKEYVVNLLHSNIVFTNSSIDNLECVSPRDIIYRDEEIQMVLKRIVPYIAVAVLLSAVLSMCLIWLLAKAIECDFKRQLVLGFKKKDLDKAYRKFVYQAGIGAITVAFVISVLISCISNANVVIITTDVLIDTLGVISILVTADVLNKRMWRM